MASSQQGTQREPTPPTARRVGGKKIAVSIIAGAVMLPMVLITLGVVAVPVVSIPALLIFLIGALMFAASREKQEDEDEQRHEGR